MGLVHVGGNEFSFSDDVHADQRLVQSQPGGDGPGRGPRPDDVKPAVLHVAHNIGGYGCHSRLFSGAAGRLQALKQSSLERNLEIAIQLGRNDALPKGLLVNIHHLCFPQVRHLSPQVGCGQVSRAHRVCPKDRRMDLDPRRDAQHREPFSDGIVDVPGRAIAASEKQKIHMEPQHFPGGVHGVFRGRLARFDGADDRGLKPTCSGRVFSHFAGIGDDLEIVYRLDPFQSLDRPVQRLGHSAQRQRLLLYLRPIAAFETDPAAYPSNRINDQA